MFVDKVLNQGQPVEIMQFADGYFHLVAYGTNPGITDPDELNRFNSGIKKNIDIVIFLEDGKFKVELYDPAQGPESQQKPPILPPENNETKPFESWLEFYRMYWGSKPIFEHLNNDEKKLIEDYLSYLDAKKATQQKQYHPGM